MCILHFRSLSLMILFSLFECQLNWKRLNYFWQAGRYGLLMVSWLELLSAGRSDFTLLWFLCMSGFWVQFRWCLVCVKCQVFLYVLEYTSSNYESKITAWNHFYARTLSAHDGMKINQKSLVTSWKVKALVIHWFGAFLISQWTCFIVLWCDVLTLSKLVIEP